MCRPIEQLVDFAEQTYNPLQVIWLKDDVKQLLAREVSRETMRRNAVALAAAGTGTPVAMDGAHNKHSPPAVTSVKKRPAELPKPSFFLGARPAAKKHRTAKVVGGIMFKFQAGFTNAVKRPAVLADFV